MANLGLLTGLSHELSVAVEALSSAASHGQLWLLFGALALACLFEFVNGFHDTANAVATVIYTRSLKPGPAVIWSGLCNFAGVLFGGTAVAMGIIKLLPPDVIAASSSMSQSLAVVFALLLGAIIWNLGTWFLGLPASSSHTLIGAILGIGIAHAAFTGHSLLAGVNWVKARDVGLALLLSPLIGFSLSAVFLWALKKLFPEDKIHAPASPDSAPPFTVRSSLILTCTGVSFAHGSNDGQKGIGLIMLILMTVLPGHFALKHGSDTTGALQQLATGCGRTRIALEQLHRRDPVIAAKGNFLIASAIAKSGSSADSSPQARAYQRLTDIEKTLQGASEVQNLNPDARLQLRGQLQTLDQELVKVEGVATKLKAAQTLSEIRQLRGTIRSMTDYAPSWVMLFVALSLGIGTMVGWRRIVVTIGERIGKQNLTYAQGTSAQLVAMSTIGLASVAGVPVSTTHVLSSGIAGTMVAAKAGLQNTMVKNIILAWAFTLPAAMLLSAGLYTIFRLLIG